MTNLTNPIPLQIAEKGAGSLNFLALLRWALVVIFLWFGGMKFTAYEAAGIAPFIEHSPIMSWLHAVFGIQGASYVIGVLELSTAAALILGAFQPIFSALGAAMSAATYLITLTFFLSTPSVAEATAGGFPAISAAPGQFLLKDLVLLAASLSLLWASYVARGSTFRNHEWIGHFVALFSADARTCGGSSAQIASIARSATSARPSAYSSGAAIRLSLRAVSVEVPTEPFGLRSGNDRIGGAP